MKAVNLHTRLSWMFALAAMLCALGLLPTAALAVPAAPAWRIGVNPRPTNFSPGASGTLARGPRYDILITNVGGAPAPGPIVVSDTLPDGLTPTQLENREGLSCSAVGQVVTCTISQTVASSQRYAFGISVAVDPLAGPAVVNEATVSSPGTVPRTARATTTISEEAASFGFDDGQSGLGAWLTEADGTPATTAGSHPNQLTVNVGFRSKPAKASQVTIVPSGGGPRDVRTYLPRGLILNPSATPVRCTEAQYFNGICPDASSIGKASVAISLTGISGTSFDGLYNMVPPPGSAAEFGFDPVGTGLHVHILGGLHEGDYRLAAEVPDLPSLFDHAVYSSLLQFWGDPSSSSHDAVRGGCLGENEGGASCPVTRQDVAALSLPTSCSAPISLQAEMDSWGEPGKWVARSTPFSDLDGEPANTVSGCNAVPFAPTLSAQPTTNLADSPTGLDVDLKIPQTESLTTTATAQLKQATVTLPEGLVVNPSSANGLEGCGSGQIGIDPGTGLADGNPAACPDASKIGSVEVESTLLSEYDSENKLKHGADGRAIAEPISGAVYIAKPFDNPFDSLLAIYLAFEDPAHGIVVKLAGHVQPDPGTGRLTTTFADNPQLPFEHFKLHFFGGARAALRTPFTCGTKTITSDLVPWSTPEGADATPSDSFATATEPGNGNCPRSDGEAANHPAFSAGTVAPQAGAYSPLVLKLSREDGSAPISGIDTTLPAGLTGKLAGIAYCPEGALAAAAAKTGNQEKQSPSCPASSEVGSVVVGAGAGPTPYYTEGKAYLAGPYKGAPLSLAIVTPATAGPYDLGDVVVRTALNIDPETARIHAVSDPIPQILQGIPLDVRSIALKMDRPGFTLNPTSCDPMTLTGSASSPFVGPATLSSPFQVGGCSALAFKPTLALSLKGGTKRSGNPALKAVLTMPPGGANIAGASVALPHSEFLDQAHIKTICTRVQFAARQCPPGSVYGEATATTPLLDQPLSGPVYLRSSSHPLPDLVADLNGQIHIVLVGRIDSVKGGIRNTFEGVPDAPVSKFVLTMQGGKKGLLENSRDLCRSANRATVQFDGQNGKTADSTPKLAVKCPKAKKHRKRRGGKR